MVIVAGDDDGLVRYFFKVMRADCRVAATVAAPSWYCFAAVGRQS